MSRLRCLSQLIFAHDTFVRLVVASDLIFKLAFMIRQSSDDDNYLDRIMPFITGAQRSFYMQTQYIHPSGKPGDEGLAGLIEAVAQKIKDGIDVRLIMSQYETLDKLELLQDAGIDLAHVRIQANVHNKGMVVNSSVVALGSQNWSADGVIRNRDATLIIYNEDAAKYWEQIFIHDWTNMAVQQAAD